MIRRASLKAAKWKETRLARQKAGFGSIVKPGMSLGWTTSTLLMRTVTVPTVASTSWTPGFGPTWNSSTSSSGYYATVAGMHERARYRQWSHSQGAGLNTSVNGYYGSLETEGKDKEIEDIAEDPASSAHPVKTDAKGKRKETVEDVLEENQRKIEELQAWQELRVKKGVESWVPEREKAVGKSDI
jgi:hypothetical protein